MRAFDLVVVMIGGALGSALRYGVSVMISGTNTGTFPIGTLFVNIAGSAILGVLLGLSTKLSSTTILFLGTGFCGGFTTFSTFSGETLTLISEGRYGVAMAYVVVSLLGGVMCAALAFGIVRRYTAT